MTRPVAAKAVIHALFIEDSDDDALTIAEEFARSDIKVQWRRVSSLKDVQGTLGDSSWDVVICDYKGPELDGPETLRLVREFAAETPVIVISGMASEEIAAAAMQAGARDFVPKDQLARLVPVLLREVAGVSSRREARRELERMELLEWRGAVLDALPARVALLGPDGAILAVNRAWREFAPAHGANAGCDAGANYLAACDRACRSGVEPSGAVAEGIRQVLGGAQDRFELEYPSAGPQGERWFRLVAAPLRPGEGRGAVVMHFDVTEQRIAVDQLSRRAHYDALTGLPNRFLVRDRLRQALAHARRFDERASVMFLDLDRFKNVNDTLGHAAGDALIRTVGERLASCLRAEDTVGRLDGDEFAVVLSGVKRPADIEVVAHKLLVALDRPFSLEGTEVYISASIGMTLFPEDGDDPDDLIRNADVAMCRAKERGGNSFQFFAANMNAQAGDRLRVGSELRRALERNEFVLHYQPRIDIASGRCTGVEALLRWQHPSRGLLGPSAFVPVLEDSGLIAPVGEWILHTACAQMKAWLEGGVAVSRMAVNLSGRQLQQPGLVERVRQILRETGLAATRLEFEITESFLMRNPAEAAATLQALRQPGIHISVDDFGTGYSALNYLKQFALDALKIDRSFVEEITSDPEDASIARAIITLAHSLRLKVIAEGVESEGQLAFLANNYCDEAQGFLFARPMPAAECGEFLRARPKLALPAAAAHAPRRALLLVDDEQSVLNSLERLLRREGYEILTATGGRRGLELLATHRVGVILSDQRMPEMSGIEFLSRVRELHPNTIRIMLSGYTDLQSVTNSINEGAVYKFLTKPWDDEQLKAQVREAFRRYEMARENERLSEQLRYANAALSRANAELEQRMQERARELSVSNRGLEVSQVVLDRLPIGVVGIGDDDVVAVVNRAAAALLGAATPAELIGARAAECLPPELAGEAGEACRGVIAESGVRFCRSRLEDGRAALGTLIVLDGASRGATA